MERELWPILSRRITELDRLHGRGGFTHSTGRIVRVFLWSVLHDRPVDWACRRRNWAGVRPPGKLPDQSTMSRRLRRVPTLQMIERLIDMLDDPTVSRLHKYLDGKPLTVARHSEDTEATFGRGAGGKDRGYKLHAIYAGTNRPRWRLSGLHANEHHTAASMVRQLDDEGYLLADSNYDANHLYRCAGEHGHRLLTPRRHPRAKGLGHQRHSPHRLDAIARVQSPSPHVPQLLRERRTVETRFAHLSNFGGGLTGLPPWVRRPRRVALWVAGKILIRLARDLLRQQDAA